MAGTNLNTVDQNVAVERTTGVQGITAALANLFVSKCYSCEKVGIWIGDRLIHPKQTSTIVPHEDMPEEIAGEFREAAQIVDISPRGAAAILRLALQKLMPLLGEQGKNINEDIRSLVSKGLDPRIQKALDILRVIGNNAVHPGELDLEDDKATAMQLFDVLNAIVIAVISARKQIDALYDSLPEAARAGIEKRDAPKK